MMIHNNNANASRCGQSAVLQKPSPLSHFLLAALHADWVTISVTE